MLNVNVQDEKDTPSLKMTVGEYIKHGEGMGAFVSYKVNVKVRPSPPRTFMSITHTFHQTNMSQYQKSEFTTDRRYNDFFWLYDKLKESYKGYIIPPLPEKTIIQSAFPWARCLARQSAYTLLDQTDLTRNSSRLGAVNWASSLPVWLITLSLPPQKFCRLSLNPTQRCVSESAIKSHDHTLMLLFRSSPQQRQRSRKPL